MTKAPMTLSSASSDAAVTSALSSVQIARSITARQRRRVQAWRRARERRGIILIFVVVLLMLLAIMGTAYLASSRADRLAMTSNGALPGANGAPLLSDRTRLDTLFEASQKRVQNAIIEDLFNVAPGTLAGLATQAELDAQHGSTNPIAAARLRAAFRQDQQPAIAGTDTNVYYHDYDAPGRADSYLASLLPIKLDPKRFPATAGTMVWPWISAPLRGELMPGVSTAPFFENPQWLDPSPTSNTATNQGFKVAPYAVQIDPTATASQATARPIAGWNTQVTDRNNIAIGSVEVVRSNTDTIGVPEASKNSRVYPGFVLPNGASIKTVIAGDADGDGIADCGLMPVILNNNATNYVDRYVDSANGVVYFIGYRVVDNSAQININTALTAKGDFESLATGPSTTDTSLIRNRIAAANPDAPNMGFFRSNVGLSELVSNSLEIYSTFAPGPPTPMAAELYRLTDARFPQVDKTNTNETAPSGSEYALRRLGFDTDPNNPTISTQVLARYYLGPRNDSTALSLPAEDWYYRFSSFGDLLEQQLARQTDSPGKLRTGPNTLASGGLVSLPVADTISFANGSGTLLNALTTPSDGENALLLSTRMSAPNFTASNNQPWKWFPPYEIATWFGWTKDFGETIDTSTDTTFATAPSGYAFGIDVLDQATPVNRQFAFDPSSQLYYKSSSSGLVKTNLPKSIRGLLTTRSGTTNIAPKRYASGTPSANVVPDGMPDYGAESDSETVLPAEQTYPAQRVSAATGTKEQLWRAYWSAMTQNYILQGTSSTSYKAERDLFDARPDANIPQNNSSKATHYFQYQTAMSATDDPDQYNKVYDAFLPPDRHPSMVDSTAGTAIGGGRTNTPQNRLNEQQMTLIRSAIAACNTIDLRDSDNDITAMTVDLGGATVVPAGRTPPNPHDEVFARVYGTEKQLVISAVVMDEATQYIGIELFNPSNETLRLDGYYMAVMDRSASSTAGATTLENGVVKVDAGYSYAQSSLIVAQGGSPVQTIAPGGFVLLSNTQVSSAPAGAQVASANPTVPAAARNVPPLATDESDVSLATPPQVIYCNNMTWLGQLLTQPDRELALFRTRRADGEATLENPQVETNGKYRRPRFDEVPKAGMTAQDLLKLVPMDAVDFRTIARTATSQYWYMRNTTRPNYFTADKFAWREFYAGKFFDTRPGKLPEKFKLTPPFGTDGGGKANAGAGLPTRPPALTAISTYAALPNPNAPRPAQDPYTKPPAAAATGTTATSNDPGSWAWREILAAPTVPVGSLGSYREPGNTATQGNPTPDIETGPALIPTPFFAPTIPIQNATPYTVFDTQQLQDAITYPTPTIPAYGTSLSKYGTGGAAPPFVDHPPFQYPYGSPFARNGDVLNVPFIGSYKIFRVQESGMPGQTPSVITFTGTPALYEYVPLPMDAVNVAPFSEQWRAVNGAVALDKVENGSVGRFDPRLTILPRNDWSADLFDYVCARDADGANVHFPDVPFVKAGDAAHMYNNAMIPSTDQDGPVIGFTAPGPINDRHDTPWIEWRKDVNSPASASGSFSRAPNRTSSGVSDTGSQLIEGTINLNTAPPIVLRMLPWTVNADTGYLDQSPANLSNLEQRWRVGVIDNYLTDPALTAPAATPQVSTGRQHALRNDPPYGFASLFQVSDLHRLKTVNQSVPTPPINDPATDKLLLDVADPAGAAKGTLAADVQLMRLGMLNPMFRSANTSDFSIQHLNADRISNLASQRSDVFTVYVTVQAWSYVANAGGTGTAAQKQFNGTRLVGERRGSFVVDRSRISDTNYKPSDLIIYPVEQE